MSKINIDNLIKQYNFKSNIYLPIIEGIVNSIDAIDDNNKINTGKITVTLERENILFTDDERGLPDFVNVIIEDNGIGFNAENTEAFDTLFTTKKIKKGGKGFGRVMFKKHFKKIEIESVFFDIEEKILKKRTFIFGNKDIVYNDNLEETNKEITYSKVILKSIKEGTFDKKLKTVSKRILEYLLPYFITKDYSPPRIILKEDRGDSIIINNLFKNNEYIKSIKTTKFKLESLKKEEGIFHLHIFKIYSPHKQKSSIILVADKREVTSVNLSEYIPEFEDEFFDEESNKNYIIKAYVLADYLNENVNFERLSFNFSKKDEKLLYPFTQEDIESKVAEIVEDNFNTDLTPRKERKIESVNNYISHNPWFRDYKEDIDWNKLPMNPTEEEIENHLHLIKYKSEREVKIEINNILKDTNDDFENKLSDVFNNLDKAKQSELAHYVSLRKVVLNVFNKVLERKDDNKYSKEELIHSIIFPVKKDSDELYYNEHNLWLLDERLSFTEYLSSDKPVFDENADRPDIFCFDKKITFRGDNEPSNPITIFEFKRPGRDDFVNPSSKEDPYEQIKRYIKEIKDGQLKTINGRPILIGKNTPFYGYIIADLTGKIIEWLELKDFDPTPDNLGYFKYHKKYNLYTEFISWDKLLKDAKMRNKIFFHKLGI